MLLERDADDVRRNRETCVEMMDEAVEEWRGEGRRGLLAVLADTGGGKQIAVDLLSTRWVERGDSVKRLRFDRLRDRASLYLGWRRL